MTPEKAPDRTATHFQAQLEHLALDPSTAPIRILPSEPHYQVLDLLRLGRSSVPAPMAESPTSPDDLSMPSGAKCRVGRSAKPRPVAASKGARRPATRPPFPGGRKPAYGPVVGA